MNDSQMKLNSAQRNRYYSALEKFKKHPFYEVMHEILDKKLDIEKQRLEHVSPEGLLHLQGSIQGLKWIKTLEMWIEHNYANDPNKSKKE